jgi:hypothetical protein
VTWTRNNDWERIDYNWAQWCPSLVPGRYEVEVYIPDGYTTTSNARYQILHAGGYAWHTINQSLDSERWVSLGTYEFSGAEGECVFLSDVTGELYTEFLIAFDAVRWTPR